MGGNMSKMFEDLKQGLSEVDANKPHRHGKLP
jgi:hypothetical protein